MAKASGRPILKLNFSKNDSPKISKESNKQSLKILEARKKAKEIESINNKLREKYPKVYPAKGKPAVILAIGIHKEIAKALEISMRKARIFCMLYCNRTSYKAARIIGAKRYDLEGNITGEVSTLDHMSDI